jgi:hypothetical protein
MAPDLTLDQRIADAEREKRWHDLDVLNAQKLADVAAEADRRAVADAPARFGTEFGPTPAEHDAADK